MKTFDWKSLIRHNPVFPDLVEEDVERLLDEMVSTESEYLRDNVVIHEGTLADSFFLIGVGSVNVVVSEGDDKKTAVATLRNGEFFGEMALVAKIPTTASVIANERCILLRIKGKEFLKLVERHPDIEFKIIAKLRERLGQLSEHAVTLKLMNVEDKLKLFNAKLDAELKAMDASLRAAKAVLAKTTERTDQLISKVERGHARLMAGARIVGTVGILVIGGLMWIGYENARTIVILERAVGEVAQKVVAFQGSGSSEATISQFDQAIDANNVWLASDVFGRLLAVSSQDSTFRDRLFTRLEAGISNIENREIYQQILDNNLPRIDTSSDTIKAYYLLLIVLILQEDTARFDSTLNGLDAYLQKHEREIRTIIDGAVAASVFDEAFFATQDQEKRVQFEKIKAVLHAKAIS